MPASLLRLFLLGALLGVPSVGSAFFGLFDEDPDAEVRKVLIQHLNLDQRLRTNDPMIQFERRRRLHGAIESEEYRAREGKYFTVFWRTEKAQRAPGMIVRLEYLGSATADTVHSTEVVVDKVKAHNTTELSVLGEAFTDVGDILAWKVSLVRGEEVLSTTKSFLWE